MRRPIRARCLLPFLTFACLALPAGAAPIIVNGSFTGSPGSNAVAAGWSIANATPDLVAADGPFNNTGVPWTLSPDGGTFARANGTANPTFAEAIEQAVADFVVGQTYRLELSQVNLGFQVASTGEWRNQEGYWGLLLDGALVGQTSAITGPASPTDPITWSDAAIEFMATATTHTLGLRAFTTGASDTAYMAIDGVSFGESVPEPAAGLLLGGAGLAAAWARRRRSGSAAHRTPPAGPPAHGPTPCVRPPALC